MAYVDDSKLQDPTQVSQAQGQQAQIDPTQSSGMSSSSQTQSQSGQPLDPTQAQGTSVGTSGGEDVTGSGGSAPSSSGASSSQSQSGAASTPTGTGGNGGWTNIQAYMNANQGSNGSATALNNTVGGQFNSEKSALDSQANDATSAAAKQVQSVSDVQSNEANYVNNAAGAYNYNGPQTDAYNQNVGAVQGALNAKYTAPSPLSYNGVSGQSQQYGTDLQNDDGFHQLMGDVYNKAAGGQMSQGQLNLQNQLDTNNSDLANARTDLTNQYNGLDGYLSQKVGDTNAALTKSQNDFTGDQSAIKDYLNGTATSDLNDSNAQQGKVLENYYGDFSKTRNAGDANDPLSGLGTLGGFNPTGRIADSARLLKSGNVNNLSSTYQPQLDNFYGGYDQQLASAGDQDRRGWNSIQDMLNSGAAKQQAQGSMKIVR